MSNRPFERYKEALRQGHLAALRGDHADAAAAYGAAASLAPDRPLPHVGHGNALQRLGRATDALAAFDRALVLAPLDEGAFRGRAAALLALGGAADAAATLTGLAESLEADGRAQDALDVAREALALASSPARLRLVARLSAEVRRGAGELVLPAGPASPPPTARPRRPRTPPSGRRPRPGAPGRCPSASRSWPMPMPSPTRAGWRTPARDT